MAPSATQHAKQFNVRQEEGRIGGEEEGRRDLLKGAEHWCYDGKGDFPDARGGHG